MQALKSLFRRFQAQTEAGEPAAQPVELTPESLKLVGGGLPRVSDPASAPVSTSSVVDGDQLPRVS